MTEWRCQAAPGDAFSPHGRLVVTFVPGPHRRSLLGALAGPHSPVHPPAVAVPPAGEDGAVALGDALIAAGMLAAMATEIYSFGATFPALGWQVNEPGAPQDVAPTTSVGPCGDRTRSLAEHDSDVAAICVGRAPKQESAT